MRRDHHAIAVAGRVLTGVAVVGLFVAPRASSAGPIPWDIVYDASTGLRPDELGSQWTFDSPDDSPAWMGPAGLHIDTESVGAEVYAFFHYPGFAGTAAQGYTVEFAARLLRSGPSRADRGGAAAIVRPQAGGGTDLNLWMRPDAMVLLTGPYTYATVPMATTDGLRTYHATVVGDTVTLWVDGLRVLTETGVAMHDNLGHVRFGDGTRHAWGHSLWRSFRVCSTGAYPLCAPPGLTWSGEPGSESDGVDPDVATPGQTLFRYRVKLTDPDNDEPDYVRVIIWKDGVRYLNRRMRPVRGSGATSSGRVYTFGLRDPLPPGTYQYRFRARDDDGFASGPPTEWQSGPSMLPELLFGTAPSTDDGVRPNTGTADDTKFFWRVIYRDSDGDLAKFVRVVLWRDGSYYNVFWMVTGDPEPDPKAGVIYKARRRLPAGSYEYRFEAEDKDGRAVGPASVKMSGLTVTAAAPLALTSLSAVPTNAGTQITFSLSSTAQVQARILNIAGRPIKTLCHARDCEAGTNTLLWNVQSDTGLAVPNGTYLVEVIAKGSDGTQARALGKVRVSR